MQARSALMVRMVKDTEGLAAYFLREKPIQTLLGDANKDAVRNFEKSMDLAAVTLSVSIRHMMSASKMAAHNQAGRRSNARTAGSTVADLANSAEAFVELEEDDMIQRFVILHARTHARTHARMHERTRACTIEARTHAPLCTTYAIHLCVTALLGNSSSSYSGLKPKEGEPEGQLTEHWGACLPRPMGHPQL